MYAHVLHQVSWVVESDHQVSESYLTNQMLSTFFEFRCWLLDSLGIILSKLCFAMFFSDSQSIVSFSMVELLLHTWQIPKKQTRWPQLWLGQMNNTMSTNHWPLLLLLVPNKLKCRSLPFGMRQRRPVSDAAVTSRQETAWRNAAPYGVCQCRWPAVEGVAKGDTTWVQKMGSWSCSDAFFNTGHDDQSWSIIKYVGVSGSPLFRQIRSDHQTSCGSCICSLKAIEHWEKA